ncbi:MAG: flagellar assembly peptidoglycan hydrolase FlgJ [Pseudomonadota bacterium]
MSSVPSTPPIAYTDLSSLRRLPSDSDGLDAVAKQFESLFVDQMLKSMRKATSALAPNPMLGGPELELRQEMLDHQWAIHLSENGGLGLRDLITDQLGGGQGREARSAGLAPAQLLRSAESIAAEELTALRQAAPVSVQEGFARDLLSVAERVLADTDLDPRAVVAQAALETGWGRHTIRLPDGRSSFNLFGIKADAAGGAGSHATGVVAAQTTEYQGADAERVVARFRVYRTAAAAVADYRDLLLDSPRYAEAVRLAKDPGAFADALQRAGYATDPRYGAKLQQVQEYLSSLLRDAPTLASRTD